MSEYYSALIGVGGGLLGVVLGWRLTELVYRRRERRERTGRLMALRVELRECRAMLLTLESDGVAAPLYRLPIWAASHAIPHLIADGDLSADAASVLLRYRTRIEEINRGLERAGEAHAAHDQARLDQEFTRILIKVKHLLDTVDEKGLNLPEQAAKEVEHTLAQMRAALTG